MKNKTVAAPIAAAVVVEGRILEIRGHRVILDRDLAEMYGTRTTALRQQVKRNRARFPDDFMFRLTAEEVDKLISQSVIPTRRSLGGALPYVFTQEGVFMLSSVLNSPRAAQISINIMRTLRSDAAHSIQTQRVRRKCKRVRTEV